MSYDRDIPRAGDWKEEITYKRNGVVYNIESATNYALVLFYDSGEEIVRMAKNTVTADTSYKTWLTAGSSTGKFIMNCRREIVETLKGKAKIYGIFYLQETDANYDSSQFRPAVRIEMGTTSAALLTTANLTT